jgi:hypothetical protein
MGKNALFVPSKDRLTKFQIAGYLTLQSVNMYTSILLKYSHKNRIHTDNFLCRAPQVSGDAGRYSKI